MVSKQLIKISTAKYIFEKGKGKSLRPNQGKTLAYAVENTFLR